jgi:hypothetical protein
VDPWGLDYSIYVNEGGERNGTTYGASIVIYSSRQGRVLTNINGSSWPNPNSGAPGIAPGYYESRYSPIGHQQRTNGVRLLNGGFVPTIGANPAQGGQSVANGVNIHCGYRDNWRGSQNCITIHPDHCERVWDFLGNDNGDTGNVILYR